MDSALVAQILFEGISDTKQCHKLCSVCKAAKENQHIIDVISRNRAELYAVRIFNCLLKNLKAYLAKRKRLSNMLAEKWQDM